MTISVFLSYSRKDEAAARQLESDLERGRATVWRDAELRGGDPWWQKILEQIRACDVFVLALSNNGLSSKPCRAELAYARDLGLPVLPVQIGPVDSLRTAAVGELQVLDYRQQSGASGIALLSELEAAARRKGPACRSAAAGAAGAVRLPAPAGLGDRAGAADPRRSRTTSSVSCALSGDRGRRGREGGRPRPPAGAAPPVGRDVQARRGDRRAARRGHGSPVLGAVRAEAGRRGRPTVRRDRHDGGGGGVGAGRLPAPESVRAAASRLRDAGWIRSTAAPGPGYPAGAGRGAYPQPGPPASGTNSRLPLLLLTGAIVVAGAVAGGALLFGQDSGNPDNGSVTTQPLPPPSEPSPGTTEPVTTPEDDLWAVLPGDFDQGSCTSAPLAGDGDVAALICGPAFTQPGPTAAQFNLYPAGVVDDVFLGDVAAAGVAPHAGGAVCPDFLGYSGYINNGEIRGSAACFVGPDNASYVLWTDDFYGAEGVVTIPNGGVPGVYVLWNWWANLSSSAFGG